MYGRTESGARAYNEDGFWISPDARCAVVVDGLGGVCTGVVAARIATAAIAYEIERAPHLGGRVLLEAIETANALIHQTANNESLPRTALGQTVHARLDDESRAIHDAAADPHRMTLQGMGATIVAAVVEAHGVHLAHVGDARAYRIRERAIEQLTEDHSLGNEGDAAGAPVPESLRGIVTRVLGAFDSVVVETRFVDTRPGDVVLLCTDGVWKGCPPEDLLECVRAAPLDPERAVSNLFRRAEEHGDGDNRTAVLLHVA